MPVLVGQHRGELATDGATTDHRHRLTLEQRAITVRAVRHALTAVLLLAGHVHFAPARAGGEDQGLGLELAAILELHTMQAVVGNRLIGQTEFITSQRIANAENDPTFLLAPVEIVATYELYNINRVKLEKLLHRFFESARLDIQIKDRFGKPVVPREWFFVPMFVVDQVVEKLREASLGAFYYDLDSVSVRMIQE